MNACSHHNAGRSVNTGDATPQRWRFAPRLILSPLLLVILIGCDRIAALADRGAEPPSSAKPILVEVIELAVPTRFTDEEIVFGRLTPAQVTRLAFEDAGRIGTVAVKSGQQVAADTPLAQLDVTQLQSQRRRQDDAVRKYRNELASSARTPTQSSLDQLRGLEFQLEQTDQQIRRSVLRAPFAGRVGAIYVRAGQTISAGMPVLELEDLSRPAVLAKLTGTASDQLDTATVTASVADQIFSVEVATVNGPESMDNPLKQFQFSDDQYPADWRSGQVTRLTFQITDDFFGFRLPKSSLVQGQNNEWAVYVAVPDQQPGQFAIEQRRLDRVRYDGAQVIVAGSLAEGDQVVAGGTQRIVPGSRVVPVRPADEIDSLNGQGSFDNEGARDRAMNGFAP